MNLGFSPNKRLGGFIVGIDKSIDVLSKLFNGCEGCAVQGLAFQDREPDFDLVEPGGPRRREVEMHVRMTLEPAVVLGLVSIEVVEDDMDGRVRMSGDDIIHEVEKLDAPPALLCAAVTLPVATSKAAKSVVVPCACNRGYSRSALDRSEALDIPAPAPAPGSKAFRRRR